MPRYHLRQIDPSGEHAGPSGFDAVDDAAACQRLREVAGDFAATQVKAGVDSTAARLFLTREDGWEVAEMAVIVTASLTRSAD